MQNKWILLGVVVALCGVNGVSASDESTYVHPELVDGVLRNFYRTIIFNRGAIASGLKSALIRPASDQSTTSASTSLSPESPDSSVTDVSNEGSAGAGSGNSESDSPPRSENELRVRRLVSKGLATDGSVPPAGHDQTPAGLGVVTQRGAVGEIDATSVSPSDAANVFGGRTGRRRGSPPVAPLANPAVASAAPAAVVSPHPASTPSLAPITPPKTIIPSVESLPAPFPNRFSPKTPTRMEANKPAAPPASPAPRPTMPRPALMASVAPTPAARPVSRPAALPVATESDVGNFWGDDDQYGRLIDARLTSVTASPSVPVVSEAPALTTDVVPSDPTPVSAVPLVSPEPVTSVAATTTVSADSPALDPALALADRLAALRRPLVPVLAPAFFSSKSAMRRPIAPPQKITQPFSAPALTTADTDITAVAQPARALHGMPPVADTVSRSGDSDDDHMAYPPTSAKPSRLNSYSNISLAALMLTSAGYGLIQSLRSKERRYLTGVVIKKILGKKVPLLTADQQEKVAHIERDLALSLGGLGLGGLGFGVKGIAKRYRSPRTNNVRI